MSGKSRLRSAEPLSEFLFRRCHLDSVDFSGNSGESARSIFMHTSGSQVILVQSLFLEKPIMEAYRLSISREFERNDQALVLCVTTGVPRYKLAQDIDSVSLIIFTSNSPGTRESAPIATRGSLLQLSYQTSVIIISVVILSSFLTDVSRCSILYANSNLGHLDSSNSTLDQRKF